MSDVAFPTRLVRKYRDAGESLTEEVFGSGRRFEGDRLVHVLRMHMWNEFFLGVIPPVREIEFLYRDAGVAAHLDLTCRLADQIRDEVKHTKLFSRRVEELGGNPNLLEFEPTDGERELYAFMTGQDTVADIAAIMQVSSEPMLAEIFSAYLEYDVVDDRTKEVVRGAELDEGNHIANGKEILSRFATSAEDRRRAERLGDRQAELLYAIYGAEYTPTESVAAD